jgi:hypothetical protein
MTANQSRVHTPHADFGNLEGCGSCWRYEGCRWRRGEPRAWGFGACDDHVFWDEGLGFSTGLGMVVFVWIGRFGDPGYVFGSEVVLGIKDIICLLSACVKREFVY